jgi:hypothetical protein
MVSSPSQEANSRSATQEFPSILWNTVFKYLATGPYPKPDESNTPLRSIVILSAHLRLSVSSGLVPSGFPTKILYAFFKAYNFYLKHCSIV